MNEREILVKESSALKGKETDLEERSAKALYRHKRRRKELERDIREIEEEIEELIKACPSIKENYDLLLSIPGIAFVNATAIIVATENFNKFTDASKYACHIGVAPFPHSSGTSVRGKTRTSFYGNKTLKAVITQAARSVVQYDVELKAYYERKAGQGKEHGVIMNAIKYKLVARMFSIVRRKEMYLNSTDYKKDASYGHST